MKVGYIRLSTWKSPNHSTTCAFSSTDRAQADTFCLDIPLNLLYSVSVQNRSLVMTIEFSYSSAREQLATLLDRVTKDREVVIIQRRGGEDVAMIAADELASLTETAYLLRSPQNAERILSALARALKNEGGPQDVDDLRRGVGLEDEEA
jgi:antitoxin YefM